MFDPSQEILFRVPTVEGLKAVKVRYPTDAEWIEYQRSRRIIDKTLGRGQTETIVEGREESDKRLFKAIANGLSDSFDAYQSALVIEKLLNAEVIGVENEDSQVRISLRCFAGEFEHVLRMPTAKQLKDSEGATRVIGRRFGQVEYRVNVELLARLYDEMAVSQEGYVGAVPLPHKNAAVRAAIEEVRAGMEDTSGNF